jgi:hypothetical protein
MTAHPACLAGRSNGRSDFTSMFSFCPAYALKRLGTGSSVLHQT